MAVLDTSEVSLHALTSLVSFCVLISKTYNHYQYLQLNFNQFDLVYISPGPHLFADSSIHHKVHNETPELSLFHEFPYILHVIRPQNIDAFLAL